MWRDSKTRSHLKEYSLIPDSIPDIITEGESEQFLSVGVYTTHLFKLHTGRSVTKLAPHSNKEYGDLKATMESRLDFSTAKKKPPKPSTEIEKYKQEIDSSEEALRRSNLTQVLYGKPCYNDFGNDKACLGNGCESYFNQSEQAYFSWLGRAVVMGKGEQSGSHWCTSKPMASGQKYKISRIETTFFSWLDICRYYRGTMSYMMSTDKLRNTYQTLFQNLKIDADFAKEAIELYAISNEKTDV